MGRVLGTERLAAISTSVPKTFNGGDFGASIAKVDITPGVLNIAIRPVGGDIRLGMGGATAAATTGWLLKDGEVWEYTDDIRLLNFLAMAASTNVELVYETV